MVSNKLPQDWQEVELGDISDITSSKRIYESEYVSEGVPFYRSKEIIELSKGEEISIELFISNKRYEELKDKFGVPKKGDLLITAVGTIGKSYVIPNDDKFYFKDGNLLWLRNLSKIDSTYLNYILSNHFNKNKNDLTAGSAYGALTIVNLNKLKILLPPLLVQKAIVSILEKAEALKRKREEADKLTREYLKSVFAEMFGGKNISEEKLKCVAWFQEGPGVRKHQFTKDGVKLLNVRNIVNNQLVLSNTETHISKYEADGKYKHFLVEEGDIIMASSGVTWGKTAIARKKDLPLCMNTSTIRFKVLDMNRINKGYLIAFLTSPYFNQQILKMITGGCQPNFGPSHLNKVKIPLPPLSLQEKFAKIVEKVEKLKEGQKESREKIDELFNSLMQKAFKGELVR